MANNAIFTLSILWKGTNIVDKYKLRGVMVWNIWCPNDDCFVTAEVDDCVSEVEAIIVLNVRVYSDD